MKRSLLLGGLDPSGGAGVTVDATVVALHGGAPLPIALTTTIQGARGFERAEPIPAAVWRQQLEVVLADGPVAAVKVGYIGAAALAAEVGRALRDIAGSVPIVIDPVLSATAGGMDSGAALVRAYREHLAPVATLITPNIPELEQLAEGMPERLLDLGAAAVLSKGGHASGPEVVDQLAERGASSRFVRPRRSCGPVRGTGCALASAIAARLARDEALRDACQGGGDWLSGLLEQVKPREDGAPQLLPISRAGTAPR